MKNVCNVKMRVTIDVTCCVQRSLFVCFYLGICKSFFLLSTDLKPHMNWDHVMQDTLIKTCNRSLRKCSCVTLVFSGCVPVRCWHGPVPRSTANSMPVRTEWPCRPKATNRMSRLRATQCSFQTEVSGGGKYVTAEIKITIYHIKSCIEVYLHGVCVMFKINTDFKGSGCYFNSRISSYVKCLKSFQH